MDRVIHVHVVCWNERELIPWIVAHYGQFATRIFFHDNHSDDGTRDLIAHCPIAEIIDYNTCGEVRDDLLRDLKNTCWKGGEADWVICCDADEFVYFPDDPQAVMQAWEAARIAVPRCPWVEMVGGGIPEYQPGDQLYGYLNMGAIMHPAKCLLFNARQVAEINYSVGAHNCEPRLAPGWVGPVETAQPLYVLHFKHARGLSCLLSRHAAMARRLSAVNRQYRWSWHYADDQATTDAHRTLTAAAVRLPFLHDSADART